MAEINLLPQEERANERMALLSRRLQVFSIGFLIVVAILTIFTLVLFTSFSSKKSELDTQIEVFSTQVVSLKAQEELIVVVRDKASTAQQLVSSRTDFAHFFNELATLVPQGVYFTDVRVAGGKAIISGKGKTSADVAGLVSQLVASRGSELVSDVAVDTLSSSEGGVFAFVISAKLAGN